PCTACCTCSAGTTRTSARPSAWRNWSGRFWRAWESGIRITANEHGERAASAPGTEPARNRDEYGYREHGPGCKTGGCFQWPDAFVVIDGPAQVLPVHLPAQVDLAARNEEQSRRQAYEPRNEPADVEGMDRHRDHQYAELQHVASGDPGRHVRRP